SLPKGDEKEFIHSSGLARLLSRTDVTKFMIDHREDCKDLRALDVSLVADEVHHYSAEMFFKVAGYPESSNNYGSDRIHFGANTHGAAILHLQPLFRHITDLVPQHRIGTMFDGLDPYYKNSMNIIMYAATDAYVALRVGQRLKDL